MHAYASETSKSNMHAYASETSKSNKGVVATHSSRIYIVVKTSFYIEYCYDLLLLLRLVTILQ